MTDSTTKKQDAPAAPQPDVERILRELTDPSISDTRVAVLRDELIRAWAAPQPATLLMERLCVHGYERCQACEDLRAAPQPATAAAAEQREARLACEYAETRQALWDCQKYAEQLSDLLLYAEKAIRAEYERARAAPQTPAEPGPWEIIVWEHRFTTYSGGMHCEYRSIRDIHLTWNGSEPEEILPLIYAPQPAPEKNLGTAGAAVGRSTESVGGASTSKTAPTELSVDASAVYLKDGGEK